MFLQRRRGIKLNKSLFSSGFLSVGLLHQRCNNSDIYVAVISVFTFQKPAVSWGRLTPFMPTVVKGKTSEQKDHSFTLVSKCGSFMFYSAFTGLVDIYHLLNIRITYSDHDRDKEPADRRRQRVCVHIWV